jgi:peroxiredoxin
VPLLADEDLEVSKAYGVVGWASPLARVVGLPTSAGGSYVMRSIFIVDGEGIVRHRHSSRSSTSFQSVEDIEQALAAVG